jgi:F-type H+-transporting ATPase subunit gamma
MASTQILKRRVRSIKNTQQITKAMELVAAAKLRRVQQSAASARIYSDAAIGVLRRLSKSPEAVRNPFFTPLPSSGKLYVIFSSDRGLAGAYNSNVFNTAARSFAEDQKNRLQPYVLAFGRKGARFFSRGTNLELIGAYESIPDDPDMNLFAPVLDTITTGVSEGRFGAVSLIFTEPVSTMVQQVRNLSLVPAIASTDEQKAGDEQNNDVVYELEPDGQIVLDAAIRLYFESALWRARIEAAASEHAMRMISMGNANRNAGELIDDLTLELNATRQAHITQEVAEIIGGVEAIA